MDQNCHPERNASICLIWAIPYIFESFPATVNYKVNIVLFKFGITGASQKIVFAQQWPDFLSYVLSHGSSLRLDSPEYFVRDPVFGCLVVLTSTG